MQNIVELHLATVDVAETMSASRPPTAPTAPRAADRGRGVTPEQDSDADGAHLSAQGQLMSQLQALELADPVLAQQVLSSVADRLRGEAQHQSGVAADRLKALAARVQQAADTGDLSSLDPSGGHPRHHGHHRGYADEHSHGATRHVNALLREALDSATRSASRHPTLGGVTAAPPAAAPDPVAAAAGGDSDGATG